MKKIFLLFIAAMIMPIALAAATADFSTNPSNVVAGSQYTITVNANDAAGIEYIVDSPQSAGIMPCGGKTTCAKDFPEVAGSGTSETRNFIVHSSDGSDTPVSYKVNLQAAPASGSGTQSSTTQSEPGATSGATTDATVSTVGTVQLNQPFQLHIDATNPSGIETINFFNTQISPATWETYPCGGKQTCSKDTAPITETVAGPHVYKFMVRDSNMNDKEVDYTLNIGSVSSQSSSGSSSGSGGGSSSGPQIRIDTNPSVVYVGDVVTFTATRLDTSKNDVTYDWDLNGDQVPDISGTNPIVTYTYNTSGDYHVRLTASYVTGGTNYFYKTITVKPCCKIATSSVAPSTNSGTIVVTVDDNGPIADANVELNGTQSYATQTDATGTATFQVQAPGCYDITASKSGETFETQHNICVNPGESSPVTLSAVKSSSVANLPWSYIVIAILVIAAIGGGVYYYTSGSSAPTTPKPKPLTPTPGLSSQHKPASFNSNKK